MLPFLSLHVSPPSFWRIYFFFFFLLLLLPKWSIVCSKDKQKRRVPSTMTLKDFHRGVILRLFYLNENNFQDTPLETVPRQQLWWHADQSESSETNSPTVKEKYGHWATPVTPKIFWMECVDKPLPAGTAGVCSPKANLSEKAIE